MGKMKDDGFTVTEMNVTGDTIEVLQAALSIAWKNCAGGKATHWRHTDNGGLELLWSHHESATSFPVPMSLDVIVPLIVSWLEQANYGMEPDHDGSNHKGFHVQSTDEGWDYGFVEIRPYWVEYHK